MSIENPSTILVDTAGAEKGTTGNPVHTSTDASGAPAAAAPAKAVQIAGVGLGAWAPDPAGTYPAPAAGDLSAPLIDTSGNVVTRAQVLTDEASYRDDFSGAAIGEDWTPTVGSGGSVSVTSSEVTVASGTTNGSETNIFRAGDYGPFDVVAKAKVTQRIANQELYLGCTGDGAAPPVGKAIFKFTGTNNTQVVCHAQSAAAETESETVTLPFGGITSDYHTYEVRLRRCCALFFIDGELVAEMSSHVPSPYQTMGVELEAKNTGVPASSTSLIAEYVLFENHNGVHIEADSPIPTIVEEELHTISGALTTTSTTVDQVITSYTIPAGKTAYLHSYMVSSGIGGVEANPIKIGKGTVTGDPSPGTLDGSILRSFYLNDKEHVNESFLASPVRFARGGETVKMTVTPTSTSSTTWRGQMTIAIRRG